MITGIDPTSIEILVVAERYALAQVIDVVIHPSADLAVLTVALPAQANVHPLRFYGSSWLTWGDTVTLFGHPVQRPQRPDCDAHLLNGNHELAVCRQLAQYQKEHNSSFGYRYSSYYVRPAPDASLVGAPVMSLASIGPIGILTEVIQLETGMTSIADFAATGSLVRSKPKEYLQVGVALEFGEVGPWLIQATQ